jgi:hypothetical protein
MCQGRARYILLLGLLAGLLTGCASDGTVYTTAWFTRPRPFEGPTGPDVVLLQVKLLELPVDDPYINKELWRLVDEGFVPLERKAALDDNGFRVGQVNGMNPPPGLLRLLTSEKSCANPRQIQTHAGTPRDLQLGPSLPLCRFQLQQDGQPETVLLEQAQCQLVLVPGVTPNGHITLRFTPQVRHGELQHVPTVAADRSGIVLQSQRPTNTYTDLSWEVTLAANEYVVIGARTDRLESLGCVCFVRRDEKPPVQRLLVIRAGALAPPRGDESEPDEQFQKAPPLASQASWTAVRGSGH